MNDIIYFRITQYVWVTEENIEAPKYLFNLLMWQKNKLLQIKTKKNKKEYDWNINLQLTVHINIMCEILDTWLSYIFV